MARVRKQLLSLLETMSATEIEQLQSKLTGPRLKALRQEKLTLEKKLKEVDQQIALLEGPKPRRKRVRAPSKAVKAVKRAPAAKAPGKGKTVASTIEDILKKSSKPMRVKDICRALVKMGHPSKRSLVNYVNRLLSVRPQFEKAGWGEYVLRAGAAAPSKKTRKAAAKKAAPVKKKKAAAKKKTAPKKKAAAKAKKAPPSNAAAAEAAKA